MAYTTNTALKTYIGGFVNSDDDSLLTSIIARVQSGIDHYTGRTFDATADSTRYFVVGVATEGPILRFDDDLASITSVTNGDSTTVTSSQYVTLPRNRTPYYGLKLRADSGVVWQYTSDPDGNPITIVGKWAYSTSAPDDIVHATLRWAAWMYRQRDTSVDQVEQPIVTSSGTIIMPSSMPSDVKGLLQPYRKHV